MRSVSNQTVTIRSLGSAFVLAVAILWGQGCLVLSLNPAYDDDSIAWAPELLGKWENAEDNASIEIQQGEWRSYKVHYVHPIEAGDLTGYLTIIDDARYFDLMPARGEDRGSFLIPVHAVLRVELVGDRLELTPLSYDWFFDRVRSGRPIAGLSVHEDQKENALIVSPTARLRAWLRGQNPAGSMFGAGASFTRAGARK
jgi:hypothetical protein